MMRWYAVFTKSASESVAEANLERQGFHAWCPRIAATRSGVGRAPLFPRYLFVELDLDAAPWRSVNGTFGVVGFVQFGPRPSALPVGVIEALQERQGKNGLIELPKQAPFKPGDNVAIEAGPFLHQVGIYEGMAGASRAHVLMRILGGEVRVKLPAQVLRACA